MNWQEFLEKEFNQKLDQYDLKNTVTAKKKEKLLKTLLTIFPNVNTIKEVEEIAKILDNIAPNTVTGYLQDIYKIFEIEGQNRDKSERLRKNLAEEFKKIVPEIQYEILPQPPENKNDITRLTRKFDSILEEKTKRFVGRKFIFEAFEKFINQYDRGYFTLVGDPGSGKSAVSAFYIKEIAKKDCVYYFNIYTTGQNKPDQFLENVCQQLIKRYQLDYPTLPNNYTRDGEFLTDLLTQISQKLQKNNDEKRLIIVIDALDEVNLSSQDNGSNMLYLPRYLPKNIYFFLTRRRELDTRLLFEAPELILDLKDYFMDSEKDIKEFINLCFTDPEFETGLNRFLANNSNLSKNQIVEELAKLSENNFVNLRRYISNIANGYFANLQDLDNKVLDIHDPDFVGRETDIIDIDNLFSKGEKIILIQAQGGVGKTVLAKKYVKNKFKKVLEFDIGKEKENISSVESWLRETLRDLGEEPGVDLMISLKRLKQKLQTKEIGILIDNLEPALDDSGKFISQHRTYVELLRVLSDSSLKSLTLITSREVLHEPSININKYKLQGLTLEAWQKYFNYQKIIINTDHNYLKDIRDAFAGNAKAMDVISKTIIQDYDRNLEQYWLNNKANLLIEPTLENLIKEQFKRLQEINLSDAYNLLCRLGCYRYQDVPTVTEAGLICLLWDIAEDQYKRIIRVLKERALVDFNNGEYWLHPVIRQEAIVRLRNSEDWQEANTQVAKFYLNNAKEFDNQLMVKFSFEAIEHYYVIMQYKDCCQTLIYQILKGENNLSNLRCHANLWDYTNRIIDVGEKLIKITAMDQNVNLLFKTLMIIPLTISYTETGKNKTAIKIAQESLSELEKNKKEILEFQFSQIMLNIIIGRSYRLIGNFCKSEKYCSEATNLATVYSKQDWKALALYELGLVYLEIDRSARACRCFGTASFLSLGEKIPEKIYFLLSSRIEEIPHKIKGIFNKYNQSNSVKDEDNTKKFRILYNLARALNKMKLFSFGKVLLDMSQQFVLDSDQGSPTWLNVEYAIFFSKTKSIEKAEEYYQKSLETSKNAPYICQCLALLEYSKYKYEQGLDEQFLELAEQKLEPLLNKTEFDGWKAENYFRLGLTYQKMKNQAKSQKYFNEAKYLWSLEQIDAPKQLEQVLKAMNKRLTN